MRNAKKTLLALGLCASMSIGASLCLGDDLFQTKNVMANGPVEEVQLSDLVIKFLGVPEYEPNRYTKSSGGKWAPEELEKGLHIKAEMKLGEGNPEGMMAPLKHSLADITGEVDADQKTGNIKITYNGLTLTMKAGSNKATLNNGTTTKTLTMDSAVVPYFKLIEGEKDVDGEDYYACYLPVKFTAEALGGDVVWNDAMHRLEMAFAFYYSPAAVTPVINDKSNYTTKIMEGDNSLVSYAQMLKRITIASGNDASAVEKNVSEMIKAAVTVVDPVYQNDDGGWAKTNVHYDLLNDTFTTLYTKQYSTIDNGATHGHIKFLSRVIRLSKEQPDLFASYQTELETVEKGFWKAINYMIEAQTDKGGWAQYYPYGIGYFKNITFNDNAMPDVMELIYALTNEQGLIDSTLCNDLAWARKEIENYTNPYVVEHGISKDVLTDVWDKGLSFILDSQVVINGVTTGWAQQYDSVTGKPTGGRAFELPSVSPDESQTVIKLLTNIVNPTDEVKNSVKSFVDWIQTVGFTGYNVYTISDRTRELGKDKLLVQDGSTDKRFGRFYGLDITGDYYGLDIKDKITTSDFYEVFAGRNGIAQLTMNIGMSERRVGYSYVRSNQDVNAMKTYTTWKNALGE